jgi:hemerythrin-like domain-containing protein
MCLAHNLLLRWLNAIYLQAPHVKSPTDVSDFITYAQVWHETIHHHHAMEEEYFFPWIEAYSGEKGIMDKNVQQHEAFHKGLKEFGEYVHNVKVEEYDGMRLRGIVDAFGEALTLHLKEEIKTLLGLERFGGEKLSKTWDELEKKVQSDMKDMVCFPPLPLLCF